MADPLLQLFTVCDKWCFLMPQIMLVARMPFKGKHPFLFTEDDILSHMDWESCKEQGVGLDDPYGTFKFEMFYAYG